MYHHTSRYVLLIHALSEVESHSLTVLCVSYTSPIAPIFFICLAPEDIGFCDLWLQVWVRGESSEVTLPFSYCQTQQCSPLSDRLLTALNLLSQPTEHEAADGGCQGCFHKWSYADII